VSLAPEKKPEKRGFGHELAPSHPRHTARGASRFKKTSVSGQTLIKHMAEEVRPNKAAWNGTRKIN